jgi:hypothetical protein
LNFTPDIPDYTGSYENILISMSADRERTERGAGLVSLRMRAYALISAVIGNLISAAAIFFF